MIPKVIHYCWFGRNPKPKRAQKCVKSWKKFCRGYEIIEWNEDNFDISATPLYVRQAYEAQKWAFVTDYVRLQVVYDYGGIYLDTDVELIKPLDALLQHEAYFGFEDGCYVNTGLGFGAVKGANVLADMMADYQDIPFVRQDGTYDMLACPHRNTNALLTRGLRQDNSFQEINGIAIYPKEVLCPMGYYTGRLKKHPDTVSIHWFSASWQTDVQRREHKKTRKRIRRGNVRHYLLHIPHRMARKLLGEAQYEAIKRRYKKD